MMNEEWFILLYLRVLIKREYNYDLFDFAFKWNPGKNPLYHSGSAEMAYRTRPADRHKRGPGVTGNQLYCSSLPD
jgi:hypothetical protein